MVDTMFDISNQSLVTHYGYRLVKTGEGWMLEHRFVMERHLGRELESHEIVHHLDGDKLNNDIDNLELMGRSEHMRMHSRGRTYPDRVIPDVPCPQCGTPFKPRHNRRDKVTGEWLRQSFCSIQCSWDWRRSQ